jgi:hypothetical protein
VLAGSAHALARGTAPAGWSYVSGGVGEAEAAMLRTEGARYSFWLTTAAFGTGAYLAGIKVRIVDRASGQVVLSHVMDGPWLFADLPDGRYAVEAVLLEMGSGRLEVQHGEVALRRGDRRRMVLYFHTGDSVLEARPKPAQAPGSGAGAGH